MDLTAEQRALRDAVRTLLAREQRRRPATPDPGPPPGSPASPGYDLALSQRCPPLPKRAHGAAQLFGRPAGHVTRIAAALIDR